MISVLLYLSLSVLTTLSTNFNSAYPQIIHFSFHYTFHHSLLSQYLPHYTFSKSQRTMTKLFLYSNCFFCNLTVKIKSIVDLPGLNPCCYSPQITKFPLNLLSIIYSYTLAHQRYFPAIFTFTFIAFLKKVHYLFPFPTTGCFLLSIFFFFSFSPTNQCNPIFPAVSITSISFHSSQYIYLLQRSSILHHHLVFHFLCILI